MVHEEKKIAKIMEELTIFCFSVGAEQIETGIERKEDETKITFRFPYLPEYEDAVRKLEKYLQEPKNEAVEDIYWGLAGTGDPGESNQLLLVGMMVDRYELHRADGRTELILYRKRG